MTTSPDHLVILPTYNAGPRLIEVVTDVLRHWPHVLVVVDGSTDGSEQPVRELAVRDARVNIIILPHNGGKGAAVLAGARIALAKGFTHALVMDSDGQHPASSIAEFMEASQRYPDRMILGVPVFGADVPPERLHGRKLSIGMVWLEILGSGIDDPLFGFRVYPLAPLCTVLGKSRGGQRYDFDTEAVVRLAWRGVPTLNLPAPVRYLTRAEGGVSHFRYLRDNLTLIWMHTRLVIELLFLRWPSVRRHRECWRRAEREAGLDRSHAAQARPQEH